MLNNFFEYLISDLLTFYYFKYQNSLIEKEFKVTLREINENESIETFVKSMIHREIDSMLVDMTFNELLQHFEKKLGISLEEQLIDWPVIIEARERRHIIVHNSSKINKKYIQRTNNPYKLNSNDEVKISKEYFLKLLYEYQFAGIILIYNCWGKWENEDADSAIYEMMNQSFNYLSVNRNDLVKKICKYCEKIEARSEEQEDMLLRITFNKCIAFKREGNKKELQAALKKIKIGTSSPIFKIAYQIMSDNHSNLIANFKKSIALDEIDLSNYLEWPIFEFIRENEEINNNIISVFEESKK